MAFALFLAAPMLGAAADFLFHGRPIGANAFVFAAVFVVTLAALLRIGHVPMHQGRRLMVAPLLLFTALLAWHDSPLLLATNLLAVAGAVTLGALRRTNDQLRASEITDYVVGAASAGAATFAWLSAGLLRDLVASRDDERLVSPPGLTAVLPSLRLGSTEVAAALAVLNLLFLVFVFVQVRYLFGGQGLVQARVHLTYAQYARHGFFELVVVALLALPLLLAANAVVNGRSRVVRGLSAILVGLVFVVLVSALDRMRLYQREYGLTELRLYATGLILWMAVVLVWFVLTVVRGRPRGFAFGALVAGFLATLALNAVNPDAVIARTNLARPHVDVAYLGSLSDDAVPALLARLPRLDPPIRRVLATALLQRAESERGLLAWNASRTRAHSLLFDHHGELVADAQSGGSHSLLLG